MFKAAHFSIQLDTSSIFASSGRLVRMDIVQIDRILLDARLAPKTYGTNCQYCLLTLEMSSFTCRLDCSLAAPTIGLQLRTVSEIGNLFCHAARSCFGTCVLHMQLPEIPNSIVEIQHYNSAADYFLFNNEYECL